MKKVLFSLGFVLLCSPLFSQEKEWKVKGFEPQIRISFDEGADRQKNFSFGADVLFAYRFNEHIRLGAGAAVDYVNLKFDNAKTINHHYYKAYYEAAMAIPVFANVKVDFLKRKVSPYLSIDCGYNFFIPFSKYAQSNKLGFLIRPAVGVDIRFKKCVLFVELAYKYQARNFEYSMVKFGGYHQVCQAVGVHF